jgi:hypothetical protein
VQVAQGVSERSGPGLGDDTPGPVGDSVIGHAMQHAEASGAAGIAGAAAVSGMLAGMTTPPALDPASTADTTPEPDSAAPRDRSRLRPGCVVMLPTDNSHQQCCQPIVRNGFFCQEHG